MLTLHYRVAAADGRDIVSTFGGKPATLSLGDGALAPALQARLLGLAEGAHARFALGPDETFGARDPERVQRVARALLDEHGDADVYNPGDVVQFPSPDGRPPYAGVVREVGSGWLDIDFNHPLAGTPLTFEVQLIGVC
jgi:FKBP-type peptidyl-prolyl cis-trans isomerase SlpA